MKRIRVKNVKEFFNELEKFINYCFNKNLPNLKKEELEENGKIYYMNDKDDTIFNVSMNKHLCYFMCFYKKGGMGAIKVGVHLNGDIEAYLYNKNENKPFMVEKAKVNSDILYDVALALYVAADKKNLFGKSIRDMKFSNSIKEEDKIEFYKSCGFVEVENETAKRYIEAVEKRYRDCNRTERWEKFLNNRKGNANVEKLKKEYSKVPSSLLALLEFVDGDRIDFLGSDVDNGEYPYHLLSVDKILESKDKLRSYYGDFINRSDDLLEVDDRITNDIDNFKWIHFADCMNNGGTSRLFVDLTPSEKGVKGQIIRYLHDPDSMEVIANSFDEYLNRQVKMGLKFIHENEEVKKEEIKEVKEEKVEDKKEEVKEEKQSNIEIPINKLKILCILLSIMSFVNMIMLFTKPFNSFMSTLIVFVALLGIFSMFIYTFVKLLKNQFSKDTFNILLIINMLFCLQYIGNITALNVVLILVNLGLSAFGMNMVEKIK